MAESLPWTTRLKSVWLAVTALALLLGGWQRARAVYALPPDFDEMVYLPAAFHYRDCLAAKDFACIANYRENFEHPPLVKVMFAGALALRGATEPAWENVHVGKPIPLDAQAAFFSTRWLSVFFGMAQLALLACVHPLAALGLALSTYHSKYSAQAYLEAVPGLVALAAVVLFERAFRGRRANSPAPTPVDVGVLLGSAFLVGLATAGKFPYGLSISLGLAPLLFLRLPQRFGLWVAFAAVALATFLLFDPFLWPAPLARLSETLEFHWGFSQSKLVKSSALPWWQPLFTLTHSEPAKWHKGVFFTSLADWGLLPLALVGLWRTLHRRVVFASWFLLGLGFLFLWPTKWPQYILTLLPAVAVCAALGVETLAEAVWRLALRRKGQGVTPAV